jgi:tetrahydromethanopterin S-methyltransferase subunit G
VDYSPILEGLVVQAILHMFLVIHNEPSALMPTRRPQEFSQLSPQNTVYKLIGPALIKQDQAEAKENVRKRLEFINAEMYIHSIRSVGR